MGEIGERRGGCPISRYSQIEDCTQWDFLHCSLEVVCCIMMIVSTQMRGMPRKLKLIFLRLIFFISSKLWSGREWCSDIQILIICHLCSCGSILSHVSDPTRVRYILGERLWENERAYKWEMGSLWEVCLLLLFPCSLSLSLTFGF